MSVREKELDVVYIAGYGRSGSSVLDACLGALEGFVGTGEVAWFANLATTDGTACTCGMSYGECEFWGPLVADNVHLGSNLEIIQAAAARADATVVVDSSKTTRMTFLRPLELRRAVDVRLVWLYRRPGAVVFSALRGASNRQAGEPGRRATPGRGGWRALLSWMATNLATGLLFATWPRRKRAILSYEQLAERPEATLEELFASLDMRDALRWRTGSSSACFVAGHGVSGNRSRRGRETITWRPDSRWREAELTGNLGIAVRVAERTLDLIERGIR